MASSTVTTTPGPAAAPRAATQQELRRALLISSGWLAALARQFNLDETTTRAMLRHDGAILGEFSLGAALDIANAALEPSAALPDRDRPEPSA